MDILTLHKVSVWIFLIIYYIKTVLLFNLDENKLSKFTKWSKVPEMIISTLFLVSGAYMLYILGAIKVFQIIKFILILAAIPISVVGFKKRRKSLVVVAMILLHVSYIMAELARSKPYLTSNKVVEVEGKVDGKSVYISNCVVCHGEDGKKGFNHAADLTKSTLNYEDLKSVVNNGKNDMMPFKNTLSEQEKNAVIAYILTLR